MSVFGIIVLIISLGLIIISISSGITLFLKALKNNFLPNEDVQINTLWGLFIIGLLIGIPLLWLALP